RGLYPWPGTTATFREQPLKIIKTRVCAPGDQAQPPLSPGSVCRLSEKLLVACGEDGGERLELISVKPVNKQTMSARDWANGARLDKAERLG
ncbi:MAG TPA: hypothetical protein V6C72_02865, partial [Chroococcales cyanobacterium]